MEKDLAADLLLSLPRALKLLRQSRGLGQDDLDQLTAERDEKVGRSSIVRYENGSRAPSLETLRRLLGALEVSWEELGLALAAARRGDTRSFAEVAKEHRVSSTVSKREGPTMKLVVDLGDAEPETVAETLRRVLNDGLGEPARRSRRSGGAEG